MFRVLYHVDSAPAGSLLTNARLECWDGRHYSSDSEAELYDEKLRDASRTNVRLYGAVDFTPVNKIEDRLVLYSAIFSGSKFLRSSRMRRFLTKDSLSSVGGGKLKSMSEAAAEINVVITS